MKEIRKSLPKEKSLRGAPQGTVKEFSIGKSIDYAILQKLVLVPSCQERLLTLLELEQAHRERMDWQMMENEQKHRALRIKMASYIAVALILAAVALGAMGQTAVACASVSALAGVAAVFVAGVATGRRGGKPGNCSATEQRG